MAEDITQDTMVAFIERIDRCNGSRGTLWNWLCGIAVNKVREQQRRHARDERIRDRVHHLVLPDPTGDGVDDDDVFPILASLHPRHQDVLVLKYLDGLDVRTIAARLGCGEKAVESRLTRAREAFRRRRADQNAEDAGHE